MENWVVVHKKTVSLSRMLRKGAKNTVFPKILLLQPPQYFLAGSTPECPPPTGPSSV